MARIDSQDLKKDSPNGKAQNFDIDADIARLKKSSYILVVVLIVLVTVFFILMLLNLTGYFEIQETVDLPSVLKPVYVLPDKVPVYRQPTPDEEAFSVVTKNDPVFEVQRVPGFVLVEWSGHSGWVVSSQIRSKLENLAASKGLTGNLLSVVLEVDFSRRDVLFSGKVVNKSNYAMKNIRLVTNFLDNKRNPILTKETILNAHSELGPGDETSFHITGKGLLGKTLYVSYEIVNFELPNPPMPPPVATPAPVEEPTPQK